MNNLDYGIIGNCKSTALISKKGSIDWCCLPEFNSSSVFAKILDKEIGGSFEIQTEKNYKSKQSYIRNTNLLVTNFNNGQDEFEIIDFMPRYKSEDLNIYAPPDIVRYIKVIKGNPKFSVNYDPRLEYAEYITETSIAKDYIKSVTKEGTYDSLYLYTDLDKEKIIKGEEIELKKECFFLISYNQKILTQNIERAYLKMQRTKVYWLNWSEKTVKFSKFNKHISRSALVLKLLSYDKSGAVLAAATTSLPETIGEVRNWDYRFCWIRDSSMVVKVMTILGHYNLARRYMSFLIDIIPDKNEKIQIMYGINREKKLTEKILPHLKGYEGSSPVRIGNDAYKQKQNDIYGILMDVILYQFELFSTSLENSEELWTITRSIVKIVDANWQKPDKGIWELRVQNKHFTFSKVLCWVAIDRAIQIAQLIGKTDYIGRWEKLKEKIKADIHKKAWNEKKKAFTQYYGSEDLDASTLLMERYGFIDSEDPKFVSTVKATQKELSKDGLMYRYKNQDDFGLPSSSFTICTFWLINSLYKIGEKKEAIKLFNQIMKYGNHLGLFSEDIDFESKRLLGNFPQAYSHLALIETAITLSDFSTTDDEQILEALHILD
jgi:GH15 family glucan-1,4-alpha-glucosidase